MAYAEGPGSDEADRATEYEKPPLGVDPYYVAIPSRILKITDAIDRYVRSGNELNIPVKWLKELELLLGLYREMKLAEQKDPCQREAARDAEIARLTADLAAATRERDAAVKDLTRSCICENCKYWPTIDLLKLGCLYGSKVSSAVCKNYKWHGLPDNAPEGVKSEACKR